MFCYLSGGGGGGVNPVPIYSSIFGQMGMGYKIYYLPHVKKLKNNQLFTILSVWITSHRISWNPS